MKPAPWLAALALPLATLAPAAAAPPEAPTGDGLHVETLENGLQVVIEERHATPVVHVRALLRIGGIYEEEYLGCGLSHWMEHLVSGGSTRRKEKGPDGAERWVGRTEKENTLLFKAMGGNHNASTFYDYTNYFVTTQASKVGTAIDVLADCLQHCQFEPDEVAREQRVVQQELLRNLDDPNRVRHQLLAETALRAHPARVPVIGYVDSIERVTREDMLRFYEKHYTPQNCVVSIVGDVDPKATLEIVRRHFGGWKRKPLAPYTVAEEPEATSPRWVEKPHGATKTCLVAWSVPTFPLLHPDLYALDMAGAILGGSASARLQRKFENDPSREAVASGISCGNLTPHYGAGRFQVFFGSETPERARALVKETWAEVARLKEELVTPEEIARAKTVVERQLARSRADLEDRAQTLAHDLAWLGDVRFSDRYVEAFGKVTPEQVRDAARRWLREDRMTVAILTPPAEARSAPTKTESEASGVVKKVVLENGLTLLVKRVPNLGTVDVVAAFRGGVVHEDEATNGLFFLLSNTFWRGTKSKPFPALVQSMDELGMDLATESGNHSIQLRARALPSRFEASFDLFCDVLVEPAMDPAWVEQAKRQVLARALPNLAVSPQEVVQRAAREALYPDAPYRRHRMGTAASVASFDAEKVKAAHAAFFRPNDLVLAVYGDVDPAAVEAQVRRRLSAWAKGDVPASLARDDAGPSKDVLVEKTNRQVRTNYVLAWRAYAREQEAERAALSVLSTMLGSQGWLFERLRGEKADYVYAVSSSPFPGERAGHFQITTDFVPKDEEAVRKIVDATVEDMKAGRFTDEELALAKDMMRSWEVLQKASNVDDAQGAALDELLGLGYDHDKRWFERISKVTREDVMKVAKDVFSRPSVRVLVRPEAGK